MGVAGSAHAESATDPAPAEHGAPEQIELAAKRPGPRFFVGVGFPTLIGVGLGYHFATGTEISVDGGIIAYPDADIMTGEAVVNQDILSNRRFDLHIGIHGAVQKLDGLVEPNADGYTAARVWWIGPRLGVRVHREHGFIDLDAGYGFLRCEGRCEDVPRTSISAELKFGFAFWDGTR